MLDHRFKIVRTSKQYEFKIIDLDEPSVIGLTQFYTEKQSEIEQAIALRKGVWAKQEVAAKIKGYRIFVVLDEDNKPDVGFADDDVKRQILQTMANYFLAEEIKEYEYRYSDFKGPLPNSLPALKKEHWWKTWWKAWQFYVIVFVIFAVVIACIVWWDTVFTILEIILGLPFLIVMFIAYLDDMFARR